MSEIDDSEKKLRIVSLEPKVIIIKKSESKIDLDETIEEDFAAPWFDEEQVIEDVSALVGIVYEKFNEACKDKNLNWEAELELGMEFGVKFTTKLKLFPKP